jgi:hypothetical protein
MMGFHVITGIGPDGRSAVISREERVVRSPQETKFDTDDAEIRPNDKNGTPLRIANLYTAAPDLNIARQNGGHYLPIPIPPGGMNWLEMKYDGKYICEFHRTDSIDLHFVLSGETELVLENGSVRLAAGDTVVIPGVVHAWRSANGWASNIFAIGLKPV